MLSKELVESSKFNLYPNRFPVEAGAKWQDIDFDKYKPPYFVSDIVKSCPIWADPEDLIKLNKLDFKSYEGKINLDQFNRPLNPRGPTGIAGRGILGKWGANFAADPIITRINQEGFLELIVIKRSDCHLWALPGGMVDQGERITTTLSRELGEETSVNLSFETATIVYQGYVDDPRNTDNAWMETDAYHLHLNSDESSLIKLNAQDDALEAKWLVCNQSEIDSLYASHPLMVKNAISLFQQNHRLRILTNGKVD